MVKVSTLDRIASQLVGINWKDLTTAEKNIANILIAAKRLWRKGDELQKPDRKSPKPKPSQHEERLKF